MAASAALLLLLGATQAEPRSLAVVPLLIEGELRSSEVYDRVARAAAGRRQISLIQAEALFVADAAGALKSLQDCGTDAECLGRALSSLGVGLGLLVVVNAKAQPPLIALRMIDAAAGKMIDQEVGALRSEESDLATAIEKRAGAILDRAGLVRRARIQLEVEPKEAAIAFLGDHPAQGGPREFDLEPGHYRLLVSLEGHRPSEQVLDLDGSETRTLVVRLVAEESSLLERPWFWAAIAGAVAVGAVVTWAVTRPGAPAVCVSDPSVCR